MELNKYYNYYLTLHKHPKTRLLHFIGHYFFEKNKPAAFKSTLKEKLSDWIMFKDILLGRLRIW